MVSKTYGKLKNFVCGAILAGAISNNSCINQNSLEEKVDEKTKAELIFDDFPSAEQIEGTRKIDKYDVPGAEHLLIHLKQKHSPEENGILKLKNLGETYLKDTMKNVNDIQKDILKSILILKEDYGFENFRGEGITEKNVIEDVKKHLGQTYAMLKRNGLNSDNFYEEYGCVPGGYELLVYSKKIDLNFSEKQESLEKSLDYLGNSFLDETDWQNIENFQQERENSLLEIISESDKPYSIVVYGAAHNFNDNIQRWNESFPSDKFSLIEMTPNNYQFETSEEQIEDYLTNYSENHN
jgi:hypothetical protein|tara:strand:+ start:95 stop:982 length:888 start_codon:yes stop_codon:yes gene_type:complete